MSKLPTDRSNVAISQDGSKSTGEGVATSAFGWNPIYEKRTKLTWNAPSGGYQYYGPAPDMGTSYGSATDHNLGTWWDEANSFGVIAPIPDSGTMLYSPQTGAEMRYDGPASRDVLHAVMTWAGPYEFLPPTPTGETHLTSTQLFHPKVTIESLFNPFTGDDLTEGYNIMKANRTKQPARKVAESLKTAAAVAKNLNEGLGPMKFDELDVGDSTQETDEGGSDQKRLKEKAEPKAKPVFDKAVKPDPHSDLPMVKSKPLTGPGGSDEKPHKLATKLESAVDAMSDKELSDALASMLDEVGAVEASVAPVLKPKLTFDNSSLGKLGKTNLAVASGKDDGLDEHTLDQLVQMSAESAQMSDWRKGHATPDVMAAAKKFKGEVRDALYNWVESEFKGLTPEECEQKADDLFYGEGAYLVYMTLAGHGVGIWDGSWDHMLDRRQVEALRKALSSNSTLMKSFTDLDEVAIPNAAHDTAGFYPPDENDEVNMPPAEAKAADDEPAPEPEPAKEPEPPAEEEPKPKKSKKSEPKSEPKEEVEPPEPKQEEPKEVEPPQEEAPKEEPKEPSSEEAAPPEEQPEDSSPEPEDHNAELPTPTTKKEIESMATTSNAAFRKELLTVAKALVNDPTYFAKNKPYVLEVMTKAATLTAKKKKGEADAGGFYDDKKMKALEDAQKEMGSKKKAEGSGFYDEHKMKVLKEIQKVESMIDARIKADALGGKSDPEEVMREGIEPPVHEMKSHKGEGPHDESMEDMDKESDSGYGMNAEDMEMKSAMDELEHMLHAMEDEEVPLPPKSKPKSESKKADEGEMMEKPKMEESESSLASLKAEIESLEAEIAAEAPAPTPAPEAAPVVEAPAVADKAKSEPKEEPMPPEPKEDEATSVSYEVLTSVEDLEAEGPITASSVQMLLEGQEGLNPFYNVIARGEPVARIFLQDQPTPDENRKFFTTAKYATSVAQAIEKIGLGETLRSVNAKFFTNRIEKSGLVQKVQAEAEQVIKLTVASKTATLRDELLDRLMVAQAALDKNMFKDEGNPLKDAVFSEMKRFGVQNPIPYVEAAFEAGTADYFKVILAKAVELMDMEPKAFAQWKKAVVNSDVMAPDAGEATAGVIQDMQVTRMQSTSLAGHLALQTNMVGVMPTYDPRQSYADLKQNLRQDLSLNLKK